MTPSSLGYQDFVAVIAIQFVWYCLVSILRGTASSFFRRLAIGALAGIPIGVAFDIAIGQAASIFHYSGLELHGSFLILNSIFSYGLAVATVLSMRVGDTPPQVSGRWAIALGGTCLAVLLSIPLALGNLSAAVAMLLAGALILALTEAAAAAVGRQGYICQLAFGRGVPAAQILTFSALTGLVYELANHFFPLWVWTNQVPTPTGNLILIVLFGYFVLFIPIFTIAGVARSYRRKSSLTDRLI